MSAAAPALIHDDRSHAQKFIEPLAALPDLVERERLLADTLGELSEDDLAYLLSWNGQARPSQRIDPTGDKTLVCLMGGRGSGKTRSGAEAICDRIEADMLRRCAFISRTPGDVRRVMVESAGGFREAAERRGIKVKPYPSLAEIRIIDGGVIHTYSAHQPEALRGPEHDTAWADEFGAWPTKMDEQGGTAFSNLLMGLRIGTRPLGIFTTTPRAVPAVREVVNDKTGLWRLARMATMANRANLAPGFITTLVRMYGGTRLFAQEVEGLYIEDVEGALWSTAQFEGTRVVPLDYDVELARMTEVDALQAKIALVERLTGGMPWRYVAVDPSFAEDGGGDECGIVVGGVGLDRRMYVLGDYSGNMSPEQWAARVVWCWQTAGCTSAVVEQNGAKFGIERVLKEADQRMPIKWVNARTSKRARAEPVSNLWKEDPAQSLASIVGFLPGCEAECTGWDARSNVSPNRIDALTWLGWQCFGHLFQQDVQWAATSGLVLPR